MADLPRPCLTSLDSAVSGKAAMGRHAGHKDGKLTTLAPSATSNRHSKGLMWLLLDSDMLLLARDTLSEILHSERGKVLGNKQYAVDVKTGKQGDRFSASYKGIL